MELPKGIVQLSSIPNSLLVGILSAMTAVKAIIPEIYKFLSIIK